MFRCCLEEQHDNRSLEVPQWMFDAAACCRTSQAAAPTVTCMRCAKFALSSTRLRRLPPGFRDASRAPDPRTTREVLTRTKNRRRQSDQRRLFAPSMPLRWREVPPEARARTGALPTETMLPRAATAPHTEVLLPLRAVRKCLPGHPPTALSQVEKRRRTIRHIPTSSQDTVVMAAIPPLTPSAWVAIAHASRTFFPHHCISARRGSRYSARLYRPLTLLST